jgi:rRNA processing protein Gar1
MELPMSTKTIGRVADVLADVMIAYFVVVSEDVVVGCGRGWYLM